MLQAAGVSRVLTFLQLATYRWLLLCRVVTCERYLSSCYVKMPKRLLMIELSQSVARAVRFYLIEMRNPPKLCNMNHGQIDSKGKMVNKIVCDDLVKLRILGERNQMR